MCKPKQKVINMYSAKESQKEQPLRAVVNKVWNILETMARKCSKDKELMNDFRSHNIGQVS